VSFVGQRRESADCNDVFKVKLPYPCMAVGKKTGQRRGVGGGMLYWQGGTSLPGLAEVHHAKWCVGVEAGVRPCSA
jgi:hypothetical protein